VITERLTRYIDTAEYTSIPYYRQDEFFPLVSTINNLYKSLSIQENIRSNFLSDISHEIRTPITAVKCYLEAIEDGMMALDHKTVPLLQTELTRLASITEHIMQYESLTRSQDDSVHVERFSAKKVLSQIINEYTPQLQKTNQKIEYTLPTDTMTRMDRNMFIQILHNIFSNFIKYAGEDTTLTISYEKTLSHYVFQFSDNGTGIPTEDLEYVREKFYRVDK
jgi:signal transduction histidine kinase